MAFGGNSTSLVWGSTPLIRNAANITVGYLVRPRFATQLSGGVFVTGGLGIDECNGPNAPGKFALYFQGNSFTNINRVVSKLVDSTNNVFSGGYISPTNLRDQLMYVVLVYNADGIQANGFYNCYVNNISRSNGFGFIHPLKSPPSLNLGQARAPNDSCSGVGMKSTDVYAIHIYNRALSQAEILSNYQKYQEHFGL
jgi:hypothetical protein